MMKMTSMILRSLYSRRSKISFPYLLFNQTISLEGLGFWDTEGPADSPKDEDNRFYGTLRLDGPLAPMLFTA